ncbi:MAG: ester cyclase [Myxococcaceae bacterium]
MSERDNAATVRTLYQAFNDKDLERLASLAEADAQMEDVPFDTTAGWRDSWEGWATAFPDGTFEVKNLVASGDTVVAEIHARGTHTGPLQGSDGTLHPTQRKLDVRLCEVFELKNGKIVRGRSYFDWAGMQEQMGLQPGASIAPPQSLPAAGEARH